MARPADTFAKSFRLSLLASVCVVVAALYFASAVLIPLALALLLSFLLAPLVRRLERLGMKRVPSVLIVVVLLFALFGVLGYVVGVQVVELANNVDKYKDNIVAKIERLHPHSGLFSKLMRTAEEVQKKVEETEPATTQSTQPSDKAAAAAASPVLVKAGEPRTVKPGSRDGLTNLTTQPTTENPIPVAVVGAKPSPLTTLGNYLGSVLGPLGTAGVVLVFVIFMLLEREDMRDRLIRLVGAGQLNVTTQALDDAASRVSRYLVAQSIVNGTYGLTITFGLWAIGAGVGHQTFPSFILWGLLCGLLRFIPYLGPWIGAAFPIALSMAVFPGFAVFACVVAMFVVIELINNNFMEPWLYGASTGLSTVAILVSAVFWTWLWGPIGLLLSTPLTVCLVVMGKHVPAMGFLEVMLGDEPVLEPPARVYQRLLALDQEEATELIEEYVKESSLEHVFDDVLLPALAMAEHDDHAGTLDDRRRDFIRHAMRDIIEELADQNRAAQTENAKRTAEQTEKQAVAAAKVEASASSNGKDKVSAKTKAAANTAPPAPSAAELQTLPKDAVVNVLCLPAHDEADEIVGLMLAQILDTRGYHVVSISHTALASEMIDSVEKNHADIVVVSALPPAAVTHARYLCKRLHNQHPQLATVVGLWTIKGDLKKAKDRIACEDGVQLVTMLRQAVQQIQQAAAPLLMGNERIDSESANETSVVKSD